MNRTRNRNRTNRNRTDGEEEPMSEKEATLDATAKRALVKSNDDGLEAELTLRCEGKLAGRQLARLVGEAVILTERTVGNAAGVTSGGVVKRVTVASPADEKKPVVCRAIVAGPVNLEHLVGKLLVVEKVQRELRAADDEVR
jgi:hypothetical protein